MAEIKNADYYLELLKKKGLKSEEFNIQRSTPSSENEYFPDERVFMNWLVEWDYGEFRLLNEILFSVYSNPTSEQTIIINKYIKEKNMTRELADIIDECTDRSLYTLSILTSLKNYDTDSLIKAHNEVFESLEHIEEKLHGIISGALENFRQNKDENQKDHYIG